MSWLPLFAVRRFLHVLAASIWVGGQLVMIGMLPVLRAKGSEVAKAAGTAYNRLAWPAFGFLIVTGTWNILSYSMQGLNMTILAVKLLFVLLSGLGAVMHQFAKGNVPLLAIGGTMSALFAVLAMYLGFIVTMV